VSAPIEQLQLASHKPPVVTRPAVPTDEDRTPMIGWDPAFQTFAN
jgi:hypothetical protein